MKSAHKPPCELGLEVSGSWGCYAYEGKPPAQCPAILKRPSIGVLIHSCAFNQRSLQVCTTAPARLPALLPLTLGRRCITSLRKDHRVSPRSLVAQFHGPLWQLQPFWKAEFLPPLLFQPGAEGRSVAGTGCRRMPMSAVAFLMEIRRRSCVLSAHRGETLPFFFSSSPFLRDYL